MTYVGLQVPMEVGRLLEKVEAPGQREKASDMHVTVLYVGDVDIDTLAAAMKATHFVTFAQSPFLVACDSVDSFPPNPEYGIPVVAPVSSPPLHTLHEALKASFDLVGVPYSKKYPEYKPHVTLARNTGEDAKPFQARLPGLCSWVATELVIWGGDDGPGSVVVHLPFVLGPGALWRAAHTVANTPSSRT